MDQQDIRNIYAQYPWANDVTLTGVIMAMSKDKTVLVDELKRIRREFADIDDSSDEMKSVGKALSEFASAQASNVGSIMNNLTRDIDPLQATAELMGTFGEIGKVGSSALGDLLKTGVGSRGRLMKAMLGIGKISLKGISLGAAGIAAGASVMAKVMSDYDTNMRGMIEFGALDANLNNYNKINDAAAAIGMSMQEMQAAMGDSMYAFANMFGGTKDAQLEFGKFVKELAYGPKAIGKLGFDFKDFASLVAQETKHVYDMNQLTELDTQAKKDIMESVKNVAEMTGFLANATGEKRSDLLAEREQMIETMDLESTLVLRAEKFAEMYGDTGAELVRTAATNFGLGMKAFGPEMQQLAVDALARGLSNISFDQNIENDLGPLAERLAMYPGAVQQQIIGMMNNILQNADGITAQSQWADIKKATAELAKEDLNGVYGVEQLENLRTDVEYAKRTLMLIKSQSGERDVTIFENLPEYYNEAGNAVNAVDDVRVSFRNTMNTLVPKYETMQMGLDFLNDSLTFSLDLLRTILPENLVDPKAIAEKKLKSMLERQEKDRETQKQYHELQRRRNIARRQGNKSEVDILTQGMEGLLGSSGYTSIEDLTTAVNRTHTMHKDGRSIVTQVTGGRMKGTTIREDAKTGYREITLPDGSVKVEADPTRLNNNFNPAASSGSALSGLLDSIAAVESRGSYNASNRGTTNTADFNTTRKGKKLEEMTLAEIIELQKKPKNDPERLFAVGRYQFTPEPLQDAIRWGKYSLDEKFTPEFQDRMATDYFLMARRPILAAYLAGKTYNGKQVTAEEALYSLSKEWAAIPMGQLGAMLREATDGRAFKGSDSYYGGDAAGNKSGVSEAEILSILRDARSANLKVNDPKLSFNFNPSSNGYPGSNGNQEPPWMKNLNDTNDILDGAFMGTQIG